MKKKPYYIFKVPIFPANIHVCFDEAAFKQMIKDKNIAQKLEYLEGGAMAEVYSTTSADGRTIISLTLDLSAIDDLDSTLVHESVHLVYRIFEYINEETPGEEIRAYLTEYIFREIKKILDEPNIRKRYREILDKKNQAVVGALLQMAEHDNGNAGSDSDIKRKDISGRAKDRDRKAESETRTGF
jgi:hypothetical protein